MKAAIINRFGPPEVLEITEIEKPVPNDRRSLNKSKIYRDKSCGHQSKSRYKWHV